MFPFSHKNLLLVGGGGSLGRRLYEQASVLGWSVRITSRTPSYGQISSALEDVTAYVTESKPVVVVILKAEYDRENTDWEKAMYTNCHYPIELINEFADKSGVRFYICDTYYQYEDQLNEEMLNYSLSKRHLVEQIESLSPSNTTILKLKHLYGTDARDNGIIARIYNEAQSESGVIKFNKPNQVADFISYEAAAEMILKIISIERENFFNKITSYQIGTGCMETYRDFFEKFFAKERSIISSLYYPCHQSGKNYNDKKTDLQSYRDLLKCFG